MYTPLLIIHVLICLAIIGLVLLQHGKGADAGAAFGSGASGTIFGSRGSASFLGRLTGALAIGFFGTSLVLAIMAGTFRDGGSVMDGFRGEARQEAPVSEGDDRGPAPGAAAGEEQAPAPPPSD